MTVFSSLTAIASQPCSTAVAGCTPSGGHSPSRKLLAALLLGLAALAGCSQGQQASSRTTPPPVATAPASFAPATPQASTGSRIPTMPLQQLPRQGQATYALILQGGPFPFSKDGSTFFNREQLLPQQLRGYYREYTVAHPKARNRGAKRIVCGGQQPRQPDACYYTSDHYASYARIVP